MHGVICELCRKRPATLHLLQPLTPAQAAEQGSPCAELHLCKTCQAERSLDLNHDPQPVASIAQGQTPAGGATDTSLSETTEDEASGAVVGVTININLKPTTGKAVKVRRRDADASLRCPECGLTMARFVKSNRFGCAACYGAFAPHLDRVFAEIHHGNRHVGRTPQATADDPHARIARRLHLRKRLDQALVSEDYRLAAELRDQLKHAEESEP